MAYAWRRSPPTSPVTATPLWSCWASTPTTSPSSTATSPAPRATRSPNASSPPAAACRSSCSPPPTGSATKPPGSTPGPAATRLADKPPGFPLGADDSLTKPFELQELVLRLRALDRRRAHNRPPVREIAGLRLDPFRREVHRDGRYVALTRKQFAVLEVLVAADGGVVSAEELLRRAWDQNADPFTNAVRITVSGLRKRLGEPWIIATVAGAGYRIDDGPDTERAGGDRG